MGGKHSDTLVSMSFLSESFTYKKVGSAFPVEEGHVVNHGWGDQASLYSMYVQSSTEGQAQA